MAQGKAAQDREVRGEEAKGVEEMAAIPAQGDRGKARMTKTAQAMDADAKAAAWVARAVAKADLVARECREVAEAVGDSAAKAD